MDIHDLIALADKGDSIADFVDECSFKGFELARVRETVMSVDMFKENPLLILQIAIIGGLRGNNVKDGDKIKLAGGKTFAGCLRDLERSGAFHPYGSGKAGGKLTPVRLSYAYAEAVAISLKRAHAKNALRKRFTINRLPPFLEFMGAGAIKMPSSIRMEHKIFALEFSKAIEGKFNSDLYSRGELNSEAPTKLLITDKCLVEASDERKRHGDARSTIGLLEGVT